MLAASKLAVLSRNLCCKWRKEHTVMYTSFRLHSEFYAEKYSEAFLRNRQNVSTRM